MKHILIGLSGKREVGKSAVSDRLVAVHGFRRLHPFNGGKAACRAYYTHLGVAPDIALRMTDGDLKNTPCDKLPLIQNADGTLSSVHYDSRHFMEMFGHFMGVTMGPDWTLGREIEALLRMDEPQRIVVESIVYESEVFQRLGGMIIEVDGPVRGEVAVSGLKTDEAGKLIMADMKFWNDCDSKAEMHEELDAFFHENFDMAVEPDDMEIALS